MVAPRIGTLGDLEQDGRVVTLYCSGNHSATMPGWYLAQRFGADLPVQTFMDRCRCRCGRRADDLTVAGFAYGTGIALGSPYQPPAKIAEPVRAIGALAAALFGGPPSRSSEPDDLRPLQGG